MGGPGREREGCRRADPEGPAPVRPLPGQGRGIRIQESRYGLDSAGRITHIDRQRRGCGGGGGDRQPATRTRRLDQGVKVPPGRSPDRSDERRGGQEGASTGRSGWVTYHSNKKNKQQNSQDIK